MSRYYVKKVPKKDMVLTVLHDDKIRVKTNKMFTKELNVVKKACHVDDKRKTFDIDKTSWQTILSFGDKFSI